MHWLDAIYQSNVSTLIAVAAGMVLILGGISLISYRYSLRGIKARTVGDGQHGTARWATRGEIHKTYSQVEFKPKEWRAGEEIPSQQGIILGSEGRKEKVTALLDCDDVHTLMIGVSGVGQNGLLFVSQSGVCLRLRHELSRNRHQG